MPSKDANAFSAALQRVQHEMNQRLPAFIPFSAAIEQSLFAAMGYGVLNGGKRLRPFFLWSLGKGYNLSDNLLFDLGCCVELIHAYSLIHDDLPCMDNADTRRGVPSCHKQYGEAIALLSGSALNNIVFEHLATDIRDVNDAQKLRLISSLARAIGARGLIAGQAADLIAEGAGDETPINLAEVERINRMKTGALYVWCAQAVAIIGNVCEANTHYLINIAEKFSHFFQIIDDLLDAEGTLDQVGKPTQSDQNKQNIVTFLGVDGARQQASALYDQLLSSSNAAVEAPFLNELIHYVAGQVDL